VRIGAILLARQSENVRLLISIESASNLQSLSKRAMSKSSISQLNRQNPERNGGKDKAKSHRVEAGMLIKLRAGDFLDMGE